MKTLRYIVTGYDTIARDANEDVALHCHRLRYNTQVNFGKYSRENEYNFVHGDITAVVTERFLWTEFTTSSY